jgi:hypothetical protein
LAEASSVSTATDGPIMIDLKTDDGIAVVTIVHGKANALDIDLCEALVECFEELRASVVRVALPFAFAQTTTQLRQPVVERLERSGAAIDKIAIEIWAAAETLDHVRNYVARTLKKA